MALHTLKLLISHSINFTPLYIPLLTIRWEIMTLFIIQIITTRTYTAYNIAIIRFRITYTILATLLFALPILWILVISLFAGTTVYID